MQNNPGISRILGLTDKQERAKLKISFGNKQDRNQLRQINLTGDEAAKLQASLTEQYQNENNAFDLTDDTSPTVPLTYVASQLNDDRSVTSLNNSQLMLNIKHPGIKTEAIPSRNKLQNEVPMSVQPQASPVIQLTGRNTKVKSNVVSRNDGSPVPEKRNKKWVEVEHSVYVQEKDLEKRALQLAQVKDKQTRPLKSDYYMMSYPKGIPRSFRRSQEMQSYQGTAGPHLYGTLSTGFEEPLSVDTRAAAGPSQPYSPSELYSENQDSQERSQSPDSQGLGKRESAFSRLGPVAAPPNITVCLTVGHDEGQNVREVNVKSPKKAPTPTHLCEVLTGSADPFVRQHLPDWPWTGPVESTRSVSCRASKSAQLMEQAYMEEAYVQDNLFIQVSVTGYPSDWTKEKVLSAVIESVDGKLFVPCFIEFNSEECKFLVIKSRSALLAIHKYGFLILKDKVDLTVTISQIKLTSENLQFEPMKVVLERLRARKNGDKKLCLKAFTLEEDVSHFVFFPLSATINQSELLLMSPVNWLQLTELDLSHNRITSLAGLTLAKSTPRLEHLDVSHNWLARVSALLGSRGLPLYALRVEGNPLCTDYTDAARYVAVLKMMFPAVREIDGVPIHMKGTLPKFKRYHCPEPARDLADKFLRVFFPLLDAAPAQRALLLDMYDEDASLTVTYRHNIRYSPSFSTFRSLLHRAHLLLDEGQMESTKGAAAIERVITKWPRLQHDTATFTVDVLHHNDASTIIRVDGALKVLPDTIDEEPVLSFARTVCLRAAGAEYRIAHEMLYWDVARGEYAKAAFRTPISSEQHSEKDDKDKTLNDNDKDKIIDVFMKITETDKHISQRFLESENWDLKGALEHFVYLLKKDNLVSR